MESLKGGWKPLREVSQADLDKALGDTQAPVPDTRPTTEHVGSVAKPSLVHGYPAGFELESEL